MIEIPLSLRWLRLVELKATRHLTPQQAPAPVTVSPKVRMEFDMGTEFLAPNEGDQPSPGTSHVYHALPTIVVEYLSDDSTPDLPEVIWSCSARYEIAFDLPPDHPGINTDIAGQFIFQTTPIVVWPYLRETITTTAARAAVVGPVLPLIKQSDIKIEITE